MFSVKFSDVGAGDLFVHDEGIFRKRKGFGRDVDKKFYLQMTDFNAEELGSDNRFEFEPDADVVLIGGEEG